MLVILVEVLNMQGISRFLPPASHLYTSIHVVSVTQTSRSAAHVSEQVAEQICKMLYG